MPTLKITTEEWMSELERISAPAKTGDGGLTMNELIEKLQIGDKFLRRRLAIFKKEGRLRVTRKTIEALSGNRIEVPAYMVLPKKK